MNLKVLDNQQKKLFSQLGFTKDLGFYLAGGTALALQLGHRSSVDFDFYTPKHFAKGELMAKFQNGLGDDWGIKILRDLDDTFEVEIDGVIHLSCFYYQYPLLEKLVELDGVKLTSVEDIAAMKVVAISQRGKRRDFIDTYCLIKKFGLGKILELTEKKFPEFDIYNGLRGLIYFVDADRDGEIDRIKLFDPELSWPKIKNYLVKEVGNYQREK
jgi:hypothetical protein